MCAISCTLLPLGERFSGTLVCRFPCTLRAPIPARDFVFATLNLCPSYRLKSCGGGSLM